MKPLMMYVDYDKKGKPLHLYIINGVRIIANNEKDAKEVYNNR
jgi:hypothetical protein